MEMHNFFNNDLFCVAFSHQFHGWNKITKGVWDSLCPEKETNLNLKYNGEKLTGFVKSKLFSND